MIKKIKLEVYENDEKEIELGNTQYELIAEELLEKYLTRLLKQDNDYILMDGRLLWLN